MAQVRTLREKNVCAPHFGNDEAGSLSAEVVWLGRLQLLNGMPCIHRAARQSFSDGILPGEGVIPPPAIDATDGTQADERQWAVLPGRLGLLELNPAAARTLPPHPQHPGKARRPVDCRRLHAAGSSLLFRMWMALRACRRCGRVVSPAGFAVYTRSLWRCEDRGIARHARS